MNFTAIATAISDLAKEVSGIRYGYPRGTATVAATPAVVVGLASAEVIPGNRQVTNMEIPVDLLIERVTGDEARDRQKAYDLVNAIVTKFAAEQNLNDTVTFAYVTAWDADHVTEIGGAEYWGIRFVISATAHEVVTQALRS